MTNEKIMEVSIVVLTIIMLGVIVSLVLINNGVAYITIPNAYVYIMLIVFYVKDVIRNSNEDEES